MKYGHRIWAPDGSTVMLDSDGIMQTWQESQADNLDKDDPLTLNIYLPTQTKRIQRALLRFLLLNFRAYSKGNASGGGDTVTSADGGGTTSSQDSTNEIWTYGSGTTADMMHTAGSHGHTLQDHNHEEHDGFPTGYNSSGIQSAGGHGHVLDRHRHPHAHTISDHTHEVDIPNHTHGINYGIYKSTTAQNITIKINGVDRTAALGGPFNSDQSNINIAPYLSAGQWNTIELGSTRLGRINAVIFIQALMISY